MKYKISDLAKLLDVSTNTVRRYEEMGYIKSVREGKSGYRYYNDDGVFGITDAKLMRKYGFSHEELEDMMNYNLSETIDAYEQKLDEMEKKIAYMSYVRHRMKDDLLLMKRAVLEEGIYEKICLDLVYVLYKEGGKLITDPGRLKKVQEFLYDSPEIQRVYIIRKEDVENNNFRNINIGWSIKKMDMEKYGMSEDEYTEYYPSRKSLMGIAKLPIRQDEVDRYSEEEFKEMLLGKHLRYIKEHNFKIAGDVIAIVITKAIEEELNIHMQYLLVSIPVE